MRTKKYIKLGIISWSNTKFFELTLFDSKENYKFNLGVKGLTLSILEKINMLLPILILYTLSSKQVMIIFKLIREEFLWSNAKFSKLIFKEIRNSWMEELELVIVDINNNNRSWELRG